MIGQLIKNAEEIKKTWENFVDENPRQLFGKWFHLRPVSDKSRIVTIVSTHDSRPMNGIRMAKTKLKDALHAINDTLAKQQIEEGIVFWDKITSALAAKGIEETFEKGGKPEYIIQARMINEMSDNSMLKEALGVNNLCFAASEVILQEGTTKGGLKIDIVAHDGAGRVFFFELKTEDNKKDSPLEEAAAYIQHYGENDSFKALMESYPMYHIDSIKEYVANPAAVPSERDAPRPIRRIPFLKPRRENTHQSRAGRVNQSDIC